MTVDHTLTEEWTVVFTGPTTQSIFIEAPLRPVFFRIESSMPTSSIGHRLDEDTHGQNIILRDGDILYARAVSGSADAIVTGE